MNSLSEKLQKLSSFKANVLRTKTLGEIDWEKVDSKWKGGVKVSVPHIVYLRYACTDIEQEGKGLPAGVVQAS